MPTIQKRQLTDFAEALLMKGGYPVDEAKAIAHSLVLSELCGYSSHGVVRIKEYIAWLEKGVYATGAQLDILQETPNSLYIEAGYGAGQVMMPKILQLLLAKLQTQAVVSAAVTQTGHIGRLGEWVERLAEAGYPCLLMANDNGCPVYVAPPGGKKPVTSTNPIAFAVPIGDGEVFVTDMATSAIAAGKVRLARLSGGTLPTDVLQDAEGHMTTDPRAMFLDPPGCILPMGGQQGYKGFALSIFVDLMTAGLSGGQTPPPTPPTRYSNNFTMVAWNPKFFAGHNHLFEQAKKYIASVHDCPPIDATNPVRLPGDKTKSHKAERLKNGIPITQGLSDALLRLAKDLGVSPPAEFTAQSVSCGASSA